jgi:hypothetical protein
MSGFKFKNFIILGLVLLFVGTVFSYSYIKSKNLINGPGITIISPTNGSATEESVMFIEGQAVNINSISLNGRSIFVDEKGYFNEATVLSVGHNKIKIEAKDKFGRSTENIIELVRKKS